MQLLFTLISPSYPPESLLSTQLLSFPSGVVRSHCSSIYLFPASFPPLIYYRHTCGTYIYNIQFDPRYHKTMRMHTHTPCPHLGKPSFHLGLPSPSLPYLISRCLSRNKTKPSQSESLGPERSKLSVTLEVRGKNWRRMGILCDEAERVSSRVTREG